MIKKLRLPILLLAVVVMLSIFYIREANKTSEPTGGPSLDTSTTNAEYAEARLQSIDKTNQLIEECESKIASGELTVAQIEEQNALIASLKEIKVNEIALEEMIMAALGYDDVLVLLEDEFIVVDVYTEETLTPAVFIQSSRLAKERFSADYTVKLSSTSSLS